VGLSCVVARRAGGRAVADWRVNPRAGGRDTSLQYALLMKRERHLPRYVVCILAIGASALTGCYAALDPQPVGYTVVSAAPVDIETYPSVLYAGQPVYFYGDRWWYRDGASWTYYQSEPEELHRQREVVVRMPRGRARVRAGAPHEEVREAPREEHREEHREHR
jgi:hypothetical protein